MVAALRQARGKFEGLAGFRAPMGVAWDSRAEEGQLASWDGHPKDSGQPAAGGRGSHLLSSQYVQTLADGSLQVSCPPSPKFLKFHYDIFQT